MKTDAECREVRWWKLKKNHEENLLNIIRARGHYLRNSQSRRGGAYRAYPWEVQCNEYQFVELLEISRSMTNENSQ